MAKAPRVRVLHYTASSRLVQEGMVELTLTDDVGRVAWSRTVEVATVVDSERHDAIAVKVDMGPLHQAVRDMRAWAEGQTRREGTWRR